VGGGGVLERSTMRWRKKNWDFVVTKGTGRKDQGRRRIQNLKGRGEFGGKVLHKQQAKNKDGSEKEMEPTNTEKIEIVGQV